ncbi:MAG: mannose-1-phosphate guanylyltransferase/mannose-6-phosphate isomerase [Alphaproteobacteria bacterium]|nr:mannose-1-phosphate guanylyltransferase/mannose-6-phosphate isomerase [Alphaproteobacteria bacterium]
MPAIVPVVLSGGAGTRLWPLSIPERPKQFLDLGRARTFFHETLVRVSGPGFRAPLVICNDEHRFLVAEQLRAAGVKPLAVALEPVPRNTAAAAAAAAVLAAKLAPGALVLLLPSDHVIGKPARLRQAITAAAPAALKGALVTFGIKPTGPHTGYGYIEAGRKISGGVRAVGRFVEKPDKKRAQALLKKDGVFWNAGIFLFSPKAYLAELARFAPKVAAAAEMAVKKGERDLDFFRLDHKSFAAAPSGPIDTLVMEKTAKAAVIPVAMDWSDAGSWASLHATEAKDGRGNAVRGPVALHDVSGSLLFSEGPILGAVGVRDLVVVATEDAVLVAPRDRAEEVRALAAPVAGLARISRATVHRPWGSYRTLKMAENFQVKQITVKPGGALSLQYHRRRAEHWVVVSGSARVVRGKEIFILEENQSTYIPVGTKHRLENAGRGPLHLIEVQSGDYLGEDDIVRLEDIYGRK